MDFPKVNYNGNVTLECCENQQYYAITITDSQWLIKKQHFMYCDT